MRRRLLIVVSILCVLSIKAQEMKTVFVAMPDSIAPLLTQVNKEDCVDFLDNNMKAEVTNRFGGKSEMKMLTDDYMHMQVTPISTLEMKLLPVNDSTKVVCMIKTVCTSICDSQVYFYTSDWSKKLDVKDFLHFPSVDTFFLPNDSVTEESALIKKKIDMHLMKASLSPNVFSLTFIYTTPENLNKEDREKLVPYLRKEPIIFQWKDGAFR